VTQLSGAFNLEDLSVLQLAAGMLSNYDSVIILSLVENDLSLLIAGDDLGLDSDKLTTILHDNGETEFVIYDTPVVRVLADSVSAP
jgi:hypothetical protein